MNKQEDIIDKLEEKPKWRMHQKFKGNLQNMNRKYSLATNKKRLTSFLSKGKDGSFDAAILAQVDLGRFPKWTSALIEWEANPCDIRTMDEFCKEFKCSTLTIVRIRKKYPGYWTAVKYKQKEYMAELGQIAMKTLVRRMIVSDRALELALIMSGNFTPTLKHQIEELTPEDKRSRIEKMLEEIQKEKQVNESIETSAIILKDK